MARLMLHGVLLLACVQAVLVGASVLEFLCEVQGCANSKTCNPTDGTCDCSGLTAPDFQCREAVAAGSNSATCASCDTTNTVGGGDNCDPDVLTSCLCNEGYTGSMCTTARASATCQTTGMDISIEPYSRGGGATAFNGNIYLFADSTFGDFTVSDVDCKNEGGPSLSASLAYDGSGTCDLTVSIESDGSSYKVYAYIQHNPDFRSSADQVVTFTCSGLGTVSHTAGVEVSNDNTVSSGGALDTTYDVDVSGVTMYLKNNDNSAISAALSVGAPIALILDHADAFTLKSCTATDHGTTPTKTLPLITDWCVTEDALALFRGPLQYAAGAAIGALGGTLSSGAAIRLDLSAWYFLGSSSNNLFLACDVCFGCAPSTPAVCTNTHSSFALQDAARRRRKRRQTGESSNSFINASLSVSIEVTEGRSTVDVTVGGDGTGTTDAAADLGSCYRSFAVLLPIVLLACLLVLSLVMTVFFCIKITQHPSPRHGMSNGDGSIKGY